MVDPIEELKVRARRLQRNAEAGKAEALQRLEEVRSGEPEEPVQRRHCLSALAREIGFDGWSHATRVITGEATDVDFGVTLYPRRCCGFTNHWFARYEDARRSRQELDGYLLTYRRQFFVVSASYIEALGLDPGDPDWERIGRDWARPRDGAARRRLYGRLVAGRTPTARAS